jgi:hypothetical protein
MKSESQSYSLDRNTTKKVVCSLKRCYHKDIKEIINIQPKGSEAKPCQVKQVSALIEE